MRQQLLDVTCPMCPPYCFHDRSKVDAFNIRAGEVRAWMQIQARATSSRNRTAPGEALVPRSADTKRYHFGLLGLGGATVSIYLRKAFPFSSSVRFVTGARRRGLIA